MALSPQHEAYVTEFVKNTLDLRIKLALANPLVAELDGAGKREVVIRLARIYGRIALRGLNDVAFGCSIEQVMSLVKQHSCYYALYLEGGRRE